MREEPEPFPTGSLLLVAFVLVLSVIAIVAIFVTAGIGSLLIAGLLLIFVGIPLTIRKMRRPADNPRSVEEEVERQREAAALDRMSRPSPPATPASRAPR